MVEQRKGGKTVIPYGPFLAIAALLYLFFRGEIILLFLRMFCTVDLDSSRTFSFCFSGETCTTRRMKEKSQRAMYQAVSCESAGSLDGGE
jgi:hypothetical protein